MVKVNHCLPKWIFIYRDGVGDGQLSYTAQFEVPQLTECFTNFPVDFTPKVCVVVVQKRINQRIFRLQVKKYISLIQFSRLQVKVTRSSPQW